MTLGRKAWQAIEPLHSFIYFAPEAAERFQALGLEGGSGYFASRSAAFGPATAETVIATFFNFNPAFVRQSMAAVWTKVTPEQVLAARLEAADAALRRGLGDLIGTDAIAETAALTRKAAEAATERLEGRPLFAAHATLPWPTEPHLELFHAQTLLREFRGDGHIAALVTAELTGLEALVVHAATGYLATKVLRNTRQWSDEQWAAAADGLRERGILAPGEDEVLTEEGKALRQRIEDQTDRLAEPAYEALGEEGVNRLVEVGKPLSDAVIEAGLLPFLKKK
ncbi:SCO6745 family protein [Kutzneria sp. CA-103260]|uniref:SCO6745 family protein n=1 Tax=Kutzneria sp. CA-103260 TaxID=2802641 RepID=UPI001BABF13B|nr:hypothetical protein [Kutzneria sp. CA-103260]QUQ72278.1 hypothetical protein JJ691_100660 [Kutzneria sp. CA-103260]